MGKKKEIARSAEDKQKLYEEIIRTGRKLFVRHGSSGFSMRTLAKELGMTHGNLYNYVASKRELWIAIRRYDLERVKEKLEDIYSNFTGSYIDLLEKLTLFYLDYAQKEFHSFQMLFFIPAPKSKIVGEIEKNYIPIKPFNVVKKVIQEGIKVGEIKKDDSEYLSYVIFSLIHGATSMENEFRMHSNILEPVGSILENDGLKKFREFLLTSLRSLVKP
ncbi:MAG: TetR/AcrR family transcriptional regulator [Candidatus Lokiarchaeota archaeon]|nr:TetR/AcrR family transcriptional regulator [Candidatus Lokiarchaeota archaeon]